MQARLPVALRSDMELDRKVIIVGVFFPFTTTHGRVSVSIRRRRLLKGSQKNFRSGRLDIRFAGVRKNSLCAKTDVASWWFAVAHCRGKASVTLLDMNNPEILTSFGGGGVGFSPTGVAISKDGNIVAYRGPGPIRDNHQVFVRKLDTGEERSIDIASDTVHVALSPSARILAIGHDDGTIWLWDVDRWQQMATLSGHTAAITTLAFSPDGSILASAGGDATVRTWNVATMQARWKGEGHSLPIDALAWSPTGSFVVSGSRDRTVAVWDAETGERLRQLSASRDQVRCVAVSPDEKLLAAGSRDNVIRLWRLPDFAEHEFNVSGFWGMYALGFLSDGRLVFSGHHGSVVIRKVQAARYPDVLPSLGREAINGLAFSPDGSILAAIHAGHSRTVHLWSVTQDGASELEPLALEGVASALAASCRGLLAIASSESATVRLVDIRTQTIGEPLEAPRTSKSLCAGFSPSGRHLALGLEDGAVVVWDVESRRIVLNRNAHSDGVLSLCFCGDERTLLTGSADRSAAIWDVTDGKLIHSFGQHADWVSAVGSSANGAILATGSWATDALITLWDRSSLTRSCTLRGHISSVNGLAFLQDGKTVLSVGADQTVRIWDRSMCEERFLIDGAPSIFERLAVSPDQRTIAAGARDGTIRLYRAASPEEVQTVPGWWRPPAGTPAQ